MKLITNLEPLLTQLSGVGVYTRELLVRLIEAPEVEDVRFFIGHRPVSHAEGLAILEGREDEGELPPPRLIVRLLKPFVPRRIRKSLLARLLLNSFSPGLLLKSLAPELLWDLSHMLFWWRTRALSDYIYVEPNNIARPFRGRTLLICHDLSHLHYPDFHPAERRAYFSRYFEKSLHRATFVASVSHAVAKELIARYDLEDCGVVPPATNATVAEGARLAAIQRQYQLPPRFILTVGSLEPRKNLEGLIHAYLRLDKGIREHIPLLMAGGEGWLNETLRETIDQLHARGQARHLGYVPEQDLYGIYQSATLFVLLSHYEGFGIPVIEAMTCGTPVVISRDPALMETAGDAACVVDVDEPAQVTSALKHLLEDEDERASLVELGCRNVTRFSWDQSARTLLDYCARRLS